jgi:hypothetical protein
MTMLDASYATILALHGFWFGAKWVDRATLH